jgi:hypothetical protein
MLLEPASRSVAAKHFNPGIFCARFGAFSFRLPGIRRSSIRGGAGRHATDRQEDERGAGSSSRSLPQQSSDDFQIKTTGTIRGAYRAGYYQVLEIGDIRPPPR